MQTVRRVVDEAVALAQQSNYIYVGGKARGVLNTALARVTTKGGKGCARAAVGQQRGSPLRMPAMPASNNNNRLPANGARAHVVERRQAPPQIAHHGALAVVGGVVAAGGVALVQSISIKSCSEIDLTKTNRL